MPKIWPLLKPFLRVLELVLVVYLVFKLVAYSVEAEQAAMAEHTNWREQIGIGLAQTFLGVIVVSVYFLVWNFRIVSAIKREKYQPAKYLNIGLISILPSLVLAAFIYWLIQKEIVKAKAKDFLVPVSYREIFRTPNDLTNIIGFRLAPDSLLILTNKLKNAKPPTVYRNGKAVPAPGVYREVIENSAELFSLKNGNLKQVATQQDYLQFREYYFRDSTICLWPNSDLNNRTQVYRYDGCKKQPFLQPALTGYSAEFKGSTKKYEVGNDLIFLTTPLHPGGGSNNFFYIARITDTEAKVYRLDLEKDQDHLKEFKSRFPYINLFATTQHIYLVSRFRILEIRL